MRNWIVYKHTSPSGKVYIGITNQPANKRWKNGMGYISSPYFFGSIVKYGWINIQHEILFSDLEEEEAKEAEKRLIRIYKEQNISYNITDGGDGVVGIKYSKEHKELLSRTMRVYYNSHRHPLEGFKHSEESKRRMSETQRERWSNPERRKALAQRKSKPIRIISVENDNITHDFPSILVASKLLNVPTTSIGRHLRSGKPYKGYLYKYKDE